MTTKSINKGLLTEKSSRNAPTAAEQGAAPDRLQLRLSLVPRFSLRFRRRVSLVVSPLRATLHEPL
jgi:hypothetical protein